MTGRQEWERGEGMASICEYDFSDNSVVVARIEFGPAVIDPDAPSDVTVEVHIGPEASASAIAAAEAEAKELAVQAGIKKHDDNTPGFSGLWVIRHWAIPFDNSRFYQNLARIPHSLLCGDSLTLPLTL